MRYPYLAVNSDADSPEPRMLVVVRSEPIDGIATIEYVSEFVRRPDPKWRKPFKVRESQLTPISMFAVKPVLRHNEEGHWLDCEQSEVPSTATYPDGKPRFWQGFNKLNGRISDKMLPVVEQCIKVSAEGERRTDHVTR